MKYVVLIIDGAAGYPLSLRDNKTSLELAHTPNLDALASGGKVGLTRTVPSGMEPGSAVACMSIVGYDPAKYYKGRSAIEALSMGIDIGPGEIVFRCNVVTIKDGRMLDYSAGHITTPESRELILALDRRLGDAHTHFYPGVSYRHILKLKGHDDSLEAICTPPHDISGKAIADYLPKGPGSQVLNDLMRRSEAILKVHPVNLQRQARGELPVTSIWLFWSSSQVADLPSFLQAYGQKAAMISGVDLLRGIARMADIEILKIPGVTDGLDNDYVAQGEGALKALRDHDLVFVHVEAPDESGHSGSIEDKVESIEKTDREIVSRLRSYQGDKLRILVQPDHPTPIALRTHTPDPVPFILFGPGIAANGAKRLTEAEARSSGFSIEAGYDIIKTLIKT